MPPAFCSHRCMSNEINTKIKEDIASDVCEMAREDIWNVIFAIEKEFGIGALPYTKDNDTFIDKLIELRVAEQGL